MPAALRRRFDADQIGGADERSPKGAPDQAGKEISDLAVDSVDYRRYLRRNPWRNSASLSPMPFPLYHNHHPERHCHTNLFLLVITRLCAGARFSASGSAQGSETAFTCWM